MKIHGEELLRGFFEKGFDPETVPKHLEHAFKIKITPSLTLGGTIDRVDELKNGSIEIIDYKTGQAPKTKDASKDKQLTMYALAATDKGVYAKNPEDVIVSFYYFENQTKVSAKRNRKDLDAIKEHIAKTAQTMSESTFQPNPGFHCDFCEYRLICEAWQ